MPDKDWGKKKEAQAKEDQVGSKEREREWQRQVVQEVVQEGVAAACHLEEAVAAATESS